MLGPKPVKPPFKPGNQLSVPVIDLSLTDENGKLAPFTLTFYGICANDFWLVIDVSKVLERRKLTEYSYSPSSIRERYMPSPTQRLEVKRVIEISPQELDSFHKIVDRSRLDKLRWA